MKDHSERIPGKNYRNFAGRPLCHWILETLTACSFVETIAVDTDSERIISECAHHFPHVRIIDRPSHLRGDSVPMNEILMHDAEVVPAQFFLQTHATNPLLSSATVEAAWTAFVASYPEHDSLFSVTRLQTRLWNSAGEAINHDPRVLQRTQDLTPLWEENSCLYLFSSEGLKRDSSRIGQNPMMFEIPRREALDIDESDDFHIAESLAQRDL